MLKIRLRRMGAKKAPFYRIVVADSRAPRDGAFVEEIGYYNPLTDPAEIKVDNEKAQQWIKNGAQPTDTACSRRAERYSDGGSEREAVHVRTGKVYSDELSGQA